MWASSAIPLFVSIIAAQTISNVLREEDGLKTFTSYISQFPNLLEKLDSGNFTVLAPTDDAFASFPDSDGLLNLASSDEIEALLRYHVLEGLHPFESFTSSPQFLPTILTNINYTNVTGGQRVEAISENGNASIYSAVKSISRIVTPDALFTGGVIHTIDSVLTIPLTASATITAAGLNDLVALLSKFGWLTDPAVYAIDSRGHDLTLFGVNDPKYSGSYAAWQGLSNQDLQSVFDYSVINGMVAYSTMLQNQSTFETLEGQNVSITVAEGAIYVDASEIIIRDYLISNGVLQILDTPLTPNTSDARPTTAPAPDSSPAFPSSGLSGGVQAGIGVAAAAIVLLCLTCFAFLVRGRKKEQQGRRFQRQPQYSNSQTPSPNFPRQRQCRDLQTPPPVYEKEAEHHYPCELDCRRPSRANGSVGSRHTDSKRDSQRFYKRFSIYG